MERCASTRIARPACDPPSPPPRLDSPSPLFNLVIRLDRSRSDPRHEDQRAARNPGSGKSQADNPAAGPFPAGMGRCSGDFS